MMVHWNRTVQARARRALLPLTLGIALAGTLHSSPAAALEAGPGGWYHTGNGVITKGVLVFEVDVFSVRHDMKCLPEHKSTASVISANCDKQLTWQALRNVGKDEIRDALRDGYAAVDYGDQARIRRAVSAFETGVKQGGVVTISYDANTKSTTIVPRRGTKVAIEGADFMRATWSILFGNEELAGVGRALISKL